MKLIFNRSLWFLTTLFIFILYLIIAVGKPIAMGYEGVINKELGIETSILVDDSSNETPDVMYYKPDFMQWRWYYNEETGKYEFQTRWNKEGLYNYLYYITEKGAEESTVLLKNENNALPLASGAKVSIFGVNQFIDGELSYITSGKGSAYVSPNRSDSLADQLENNGVMVNSQLTNLYQELNSTYHKSQYDPKPNGDINVTEFVVNEAPVSKVSTVADSTIEGYGDAAIFIISRNGSECGDTDFYADNHVDNNYLDLTYDEMGVIEKLVEYKEQGKLKSIVLVINSATAMQFKTIANYDIDAILFAGTGGVASLSALADVLTGDADPNGRLPDTFAYDNYSAPATENFGDFTYVQSAGVPKVEKYSHNNKYVVYQEGIYVGYKYYETRYEDMVMGNGNAVGTFGSKNSDGEWSYASEVAYPFGYGSSYATFEQSDFKVTKSLLEDKYIATITIKNTSDKYSGKDVFQLYLQKPYTVYDVENGVEKASVELVGIAKTKLLAPGESETLTITVDGSYLASYDANNAKTYILEKGDYYFTAAHDSHNAVNNILAAKGFSNDYTDARGNADMTHKLVIEQDNFEIYSISKTGVKITNQFDDVDLNKYEYTKDEQSITYLTRSNWAGTYPSAVSLTCTNPGMIADMQYAREIEEDPNVEMPTFGADNGLSLIDLMYRDYNDPLWDKLLDQLTKDDIKTLVFNGWTLEGIASVNAPGTKVGDGPVGLRHVGGTNNYPGGINTAATFNPELVYDLGEAYGMELNYLGYKALWGTGANIHRSAFGGRNFEYFSEDAILGGIILNHQMAGLTDMGIITYTKHFALNDQERNRYGGCTWANEQSIREIYLKPFQITIESTDNNMVGLMSSFNRFGTTWAGIHKGLLTNVLREEWGFKGTVVTDCAVGHHMGQNGQTQVLANALIAGTSYWLHDMRGQWNTFQQYLENPVVAQAFRQAAKDHLYSRLNSSIMNGMKSGMKIVEITPWWVEYLNTAETVVGYVTVGTASMMVLSFIVVPIFKKGGWM